MGCRPPDGPAAADSRPVTCDVFGGAMRVVIADDSLIVRAGLAALLQELGHEVVAQTGRAEQVPALVAAYSPDVLVVDLRMPPTFTDEGLRAASGVKQRHPQVGVLVLSQDAVPGGAATPLGPDVAGTGYLLKERVTEPRALRDALGRVAEGGIVVEPSVLPRCPPVRPRPATTSLTPREREVLQLMAEGLSNQGIADRLQLTMNTIGTHVQHVFSKLGVADSPAGNRRVLAVLAFLDR